MVVRPQRVNMRDVHSYTVVHSAAFSGSVEIIKIPLDKVMSVDVTNE